MPLGSINSSGITTGSDGKVRVSGLSSSIDSLAIINAQVAARRQPAVQLEAKITANTTLATAYTELKTRTSSVATSLNALRSAPGSAADVFNSKIASGTTAAASGAPSGFTPSSINTLLLTSISANAQAGTHTIKIQQTAAAQQIRTDAIASTTASLSSQGISAGTFTLNGKTITVSATDTLNDLRANLNAADAGVNATLVSAGPTSNYLVLTSSNTGTANTLNFTGSFTATDELGLTTALGAVQTQLTAARDALLDVNGITGITRSSNTISDIIGGVTLNLLKSETDTEITLKIEPDLNTIKTAIATFVDAYNEVRAFNTEQRTAADRNADGTVADGELGPLAYDQRLRDIVNKLGTLASTSLGGNADGFRSLSQLGITVQSDFTLKVDDATLDARLLSNVGEVKKLFGFTSTSTDSRATVLGRTAETVSGTYYLNVGGTDGTGNITSANIRTTAGSGTGGADDGSASVSGTILTGLTGNSTGLGVAFNGAASLGPVNDIAITISRGLADQFYDFFADQVKPSIGGLDTANTELLTQNKSFQDRIQVLDDRIVFFRANLEARFTRMETALAQLETLRSTIQSYLDSGNSNS